MLNLIYEIKFNDPLLDLLYIFMILFISAIFGIITHILGANRGFTRTQFWWGFCLWVLGVCMVAAMPTYRIYDDEEMEDSEDVKGRELNHYAPALKPRTLNTKKVEKPAEKKESQYWGNDIDSIVENKEDNK